MNSERRVLRKVVVGLDYMGKSMHYITGQTVNRGSATIHLIEEDELGCVNIWIKNNQNEIQQWKRLTSTMPMVTEDYLDFD